MATDPKDPTTSEEEHQPVLDRVQEPSMRPDGTADQMDGYEIIEDPEADAEAAEEAAPKRRSRKINPETTAER